MNIEGVPCQKRNERHSDCAISAYPTSARRMKPRDAMVAIKNLGISNYLEQQLNYTFIDDGSLEADIQALFPLTMQTPALLINGFPDNIFNVAGSRLK